MPKISLTQLQILAIIIRLNNQKEISFTIQQLYLEIQYKD